MLRATIRQTLFCQNVVSKNSLNFIDAKVSRYTVLDGPSSTAQKETTTVEDTVERPHEAAA